MENEMRGAGPTPDQMDAQVLYQIYENRLAELKDYLMQNIVANPATPYAEGMSDACNRVLRKFSILFPEMEKR